jgi:hypothetical protein
MVRTINTGNFVKLIERGGPYMARYALDMQATVAKSTEECALYRSEGPLPGIKEFHATSKGPQEHCSMRSYAKAARSLGTQVTARWVARRIDHV